MTMLRAAVLLSVTATAALLLTGASACTNYLVTPGASADGAALVAYSADSGSLYGTLGFYPAADHPAGSKKDIWDWDSGLYLGQIDEVSHTHQVVGNSNEFQLTIGETTFGGLSSLSSQPGAVLDYGSLIWTTLQRATTVAEAITVMDELMQTWGYASDGESFSLADPNEVWLMEVIGKGPGEKGSVWVACRIPDGTVTGHANQARIRTFPHDDNSTCRYASDVVSFAVSKGLYPKTADPADFSFSDTFDPVSFTGARLAELRVWNFFRQVAAEPDFGDTYMDYVSGKNLTHRMPLYIKVKEKISLNDTFGFMRAHYEGTPFDMREDVGAGPWAAAMRTRPLFWKDGDTQYHNERPIGVQQTGWHFVAQMRSWLPRQIGTIVWFGVDDTTHSVHVPFYPSISSVPATWGDAGVQHVDDTSDALGVRFDRAFWVFNMVSNFVYNRWSDAHPIVASAVADQEATFFDATRKVETTAAPLIKSGKIEEAIALLTKSCKSWGDGVVASWLDLWKSLFFRFRDKFTVTAPPKTSNPQDHPWPSVNQQGWSERWRGKIVADTGKRYVVPTTRHDERKREVMGL